MYTNHLLADIIPAAEKLANAADNAGGSTTMVVVIIVTLSIFLVVNLMVWLDGRQEAQAKAREELRDRLWTSQLGTYETFLKTLVSAVETTNQGMMALQKTVGEMDRRLWSNDQLNNIIENRIHTAIQCHAERCQKQIKE